MKSFRNIISVGIAMLTLSSCGNDTEITSYRGKVKFELFNLSLKLFNNMLTVLPSEITSSAIKES